MRVTKLTILFTGLLTLAGAHCGGQTSSTGTGGGGGGPSDVFSGDAGAIEHLPTGLPATCSIARGPGAFQPSADAGTPSQPECLKDADCKSGTNGRCDYPMGNGTRNFGACTYDQCATDAACGTGNVCVCRTTEHASSANVCIVADCKSDSECASGICAKSVDRSTCDRPESYHCLNPAADECEQDSDCRSQNFGNCQFSTMKGHFACNYSICSG